MIFALTFLLVVIMAIAAYMALHLSFLFFRDGDDFAAFMFLFVGLIALGTAGFTAYSVLTL